MTMARNSRSLLCLAMLAAGWAHPAGAQSTLDQRMHGFLGAVRELGHPDPVAGFFPRRGDWTWVQRLTNAPAPLRTVTWRFPGAETRRAMEPGAPLCYSLAWYGGDYGPHDGAMLWQASIHEGRWRRVTGTRYVPPGEGADSPTFVEWRREDGRWVISALGEEHFYHRPRPPNERRNLVTRDTLTERTTFAAGHTWFIAHEMIEFRDHAYVKAGLPRRIALDGVRRFGSLGTVPVYVEAGPGRPDATVLYLPVSPGELQPYQPASGSSCDVW